MGLETQAETIVDTQNTVDTHSSDLETSSAHEHENPVPEITTEGSLASISLLELAEVLDQHRLWVESGGETGAKADLCGVNLAKADLTGVNLQGASLQRMNLAGADLSMANLRGASLVQADLRDTNLLGTELRGANLMGANLYGAEGVWVGRLGGANLFDAILPETVAAFDSSRAIEDATKVARWFYFLMLSLSAICAVLVATTSDLRLILNSSAIPLSHLGNVLPMTGFYLGGPLLRLVVPMTRFFPTWRIRRHQKLLQSNGFLLGTDHPPPFACGKSPAPKYRRPRGNSGAENTGLRTGWSTLAESSRSFRNGFRVYKVQGPAGDFRFRTIQTREVFLMSSAVLIEGQPIEGRPDGPVAGALHTAVLILILLGAASLMYFSTGRMRTAGHPNRVAFYMTTVAWEWALTAYVLFGVKRYGKSLVEVTGARWKSAKDVFRDIGIALVFWIVALVVLALTELALGFHGSKETLSALAPEGHSGKKYSGRRIPRPGDELFLQISAKNRLLAKTRGHAHQNPRGDLRRTFGRECAQRLLRAVKAQRKLRQCENH